MQTATKWLFTASKVGILMAFLAATSTIAGEVIGPPTEEFNTNQTAAPEHARSPCAFSGLNDFDPAEGQNDSQVQTAADSWKYYELEKGIVGLLCRGVFY